MVQISAFIEAIYYCLQGCFFMPFAYLLIIAYTEYFWLFFNNLYVTHILSWGSMLRFLFLNLKFKYNYVLFLPLIMQILNYSENIERNSLEYWMYRIESYLDIINCVSLTVIVELIEPFVLQFMWLMILTVMMHSAYFLAIGSFELVLNSRICVLNSVS